jgi:hypothetical protein
MRLMAALLFLIVVLGGLIVLFTAILFALTNGL